MVSKDAYWMQHAFDLALKAQAQNEIPVGAVLISKEGELLGCGWNQVEKKHNPCAHAEILAIEEAAARIHNHRLLGTTLYVTLEPCSMCAGALIHARVNRLVFGARDFKAGAAGSVYNLLSGSLLNHQIQIDEGILEKECSNLLSDFFKLLRTSN